MILISQHDDLPRLLIWLRLGQNVMIISVIFWRFRFTSVLGATFVIGLKYRLIQGTDFY